MTLKKFWGIALISLLLALIMFLLLEMFRKLENKTNCKL